MTGLALVFLVMLVASLLFSSEQATAPAQASGEPLAMLGVAPGTGGEPDEQAAPPVAPAARKTSAVAPAAPQPMPTDI